MKRFMLVVVLFVCTTFSYSQKSICGVDFGSSYEAAKSILEGKFGKAEVEKNNEICYFDREYAGYNFYAIWFSFQSDGYNTYFNECYFADRFTDITLAKKFKNILLAKLSAKYDTPTTGIDDKGLPWAIGGVSPVSDYEPGYHLFITKDDKDKFYYVHLSYGPYNYANEEF